MRASTSIRAVLALLLLFLGTSCANEEKGKKEEMTEAEKKAFRDSIRKENRRLARYEDRAIEDYIERRGWEMKKTGTGLRYKIEKEGSGAKAKKGMLAKVDYRVELLSGELIYSSEKSGPKTFLIGRDHEVTGLHQGIQFMREGGEAVFIMPYHLGHGLLGDMKKIPVKSTIVYHIELLELKTPR